MPLSAPTFTTGPNSKLQVFAETVSMPASSTTLYSDTEMLNYYVPISLTKSVYSMPLLKFFIRSISVKIDTFQSFC